METKTAPFVRILLPVDRLEVFRRAAPLAGLLVRTMEIEAEKIDLLHVIEGSFLSKHMERYDLSKGEVPDADELKRLHTSHLEQNVKPLLASSSELFMKLAAGRQPGQLIQDGDPVKVISKVAGEQRYSTLVMGRRKLARESNMIATSVVAGVLHRHADATVYLAGERELAEHESLFARCLIGVDDSVASRGAVQEAALLLSRVPDQVEQIFLVHVLDQSCYYDEDGQSCLQVSMTGQQALEQACEQLIAAGIDQKKITTVIHFGRPGTVLVEEIVECDATMIFIGRRDRSRMAQVFLGSVCTEIVQNCRERALVLVS